MTPLRPRGGPNRSRAAASAASAAFGAFNQQNKDASANEAPAYRPERHAVRFERSKSLMFV